MRSGSENSGSDFDTAFKHRNGWSRHEHGLTHASPGNRQIAAARMDPHGRHQQATQDARHDRFAGARTTGQGLARTTLEDPKLDFMTVEHLHETHVDASRETRVMLDQRALPLDRSHLDIGNDLDRMRVAH